MTTCKTDEFGYNHMRSLSQAAQRILALAMVVAVSLSGALAATSATAVESPTSGSFDNVSPEIDYKGSWVQQTSSSKDASGTLAVAKVTGDSAEFTFHSTGVRWVARTGSSMGIADLSIDGTKVTSVDLYSPEQQYQKTLFSTTSLSEATHTLKIVRTGTHNSLSSGNDVTIDSLEVIDSIAPATPASLRVTQVASVAVLDWDANDEADLSGYRIYRSDSLDAQSALLASLGASITEYVDPTVVPGSTVSYRLTALDNSGNESTRSVPASIGVNSDAVAGSGRIEDSASDLLYLKGTWSTAESSGDTGRTSASAKNTGDYAHLAFEGGSVSLVSRTGTYLGRATVFIDGAEAAVVDLYSPTNLAQQVVFRSQSLGSGVHTIQIVRSGTKNTASSGNDIVIDALDVADGVAPAAPSTIVSTVDHSMVKTTWSPPADADVASFTLYRKVAGESTLKLATSGPNVLSYSDANAPIGTPVFYLASATDSSGNESAQASGAAVTVPLSTVVKSGRYEQDSPGITLSGTWETMKHSSDSGGTSANAKITGDFAQIVFDQSGVQWVARTGPSLGISKVYLDDNLVATVDLYSASQQFQKVMYSNQSLDGQTHRLRVVRTGTKNAQSSGNDLSLDSFVISDKIAPSAPSQVTATNTREGVQLAWSNTASTDSAGYKLYRAVGQGSFQQINSANLLQGNSFLDVGLTPSQEYRFSVTTTDTSGNESVKSKFVYITPPAFAVVGGRYANCPTTGAVTVTTTNALRAAVAAAKAGTVIRLAPGTYDGGVTVTASGTASQPIWICGPRTAIINHKNTSASNGFLLNKVAYVNISGLTITNSRKGVIASGSSHITFSDLAISNIGEEAVKLRYGTTDSVVVGNTISTTGVVSSGFGEGVYIGTSPENWCESYSCQPDKSDRNSIIANSISNTSADPIEAKPGTTGGIIRGNTISGAGLTDVTTLMAVKGNSYLVLDNVASYGKLPVGFKVIQGEVDGYGLKNIFARNTVTLPAGGVGFSVPTGSGNVVDCTNKVTGTGKTLSNVACQK